MRTITKIKLACAAVAIVGPIVALRACVPRTAEHLALAELGAGFRRTQIGALTVLTDCPPESLVELGVAIEAFCEAVGARWGDRLALARLSPDQGITVKVFARGADFERARDRTSVGRHAAAFYDPAGRTLYLARDDRHFTATAIHETTHLLFDLGGAGHAPPWLHEGLAAYFEGTLVAVADGHLRVTLRGPARRYVMSLIALGERAPAIATLLEAGPDEFYGRGGVAAPDAETIERVEASYAVAACLVGFLIETSPATLEAIVREARQQRPVAAAWLGLKLGAPPDELDRRLRRFVLGRATPDDR